MEKLTLPVLAVSEAAYALLGGEIAVRIRLPGMRDCVDDVMAAMRAAVPVLLAFPSELQRRYMYLRPPFDTESECDDGWIVRHGGSQSHLRDEKVYFHLRPEMLCPWLNEQGLNSQWFADLLKQAKCLRKGALVITQDLLESMDEQLGSDSPGLSEKLVVQREEFVLRVLQYLAQGKQGQLGNRHWDKSFVTLQLGESINGLVLIDPVTGKHGHVESTPDTVIAFFGKQAGILLRDRIPTVRPIEHYITDYCQPGEMRNGIVSFAHLLPSEEVARISPGNVPP